MSDPLAQRDAAADLANAPLFAPPRSVVPPRRQGRRPMASTSIAAHRARPRGGDAARILELIRSHGPMTIDRAAELLGKHPHQISPRFGELEARRQLIRLDQTAPTRAGKAAVLWSLSGTSLQPQENLE